MAERAATDQMFTQPTLPGLAAMIPRRSVAGFLTIWAASKFTWLDDVLIAIAGSFLMLRPGLMKPVPNKCLLRK